MTYSTRGDGRTPLTIRTSHDAIAAIPYLLGFHPELSLVALGFDGPHDTCALRLDLPADDRPLVRTEAAAQVVNVLVQNRFQQALLLGYGPAGRVDPMVGVVWHALEAAGLEVREAVRVADGRWWSYGCDDPRCCPPEGTPIDIAGSVVAAQATLAGHVARTGRHELVTAVAPVGGTARESMRRATDRAEQRLLDLMVAGDPGDTGDTGDPGDAPATGSSDVSDRRIQAGLALVKELAARVPRGAGPPSDDEVAWLTVLLTELRVRDEAWVRINVDDPAHLAFWLDVTRRAQEPYAAAPAALLAYTAAAAGDGGLANVALDRADAADPTYSMAALLRELLLAGIPPAKLRLNMTPRQLAAAYAQQTPHPRGG